MSQKAVLVRVNGNLVQEVFNSVPDYEEAVQICKDEGYEADDNYFSNYYSVEYEWLDIGEGESGVNEFIDEETLLAIYDSYDYERYIYETFGLNVEVIESGSYEVDIDDLKEED